nr:MAG TPA: hypothetical protein [Caudoviricetes sp.]
MIIVYRYTAVKMWRTMEQIDILLFYNERNIIIWILL